MWHEEEQMRRLGLAASTRWMAAVAALASLAALAAPGDSQDAPHLTIVLKPEFPRSDHNIPAVDVWLTIDAVHVAPG
jgi:hypothetical protein